jgi:hypothetical protein
MNAQYLINICNNLITKYNISNENFKSFHICALLCNNNVIAIGEKSLRKLSTCPLSTHAEMHMLYKINKNPKLSNRQNKKYDILVIRISKNGSLGMSRPCYHCIKTLLANNNINIVNVYYSDNDGNIICEKLVNMADSELTVISSGWKTRSGQKSKNNYEQKTKMPNIYSSNNIKRYYKIS